MTKKEFGIIIDTLKTYYPKEKICPNQQAMELWYINLKDIDYKLLSDAISEWVVVNKWSPSIADLRSKVVEMVSEAPLWSEGWGKVKRAIRHYGIYQEHEALESLDEISRQCVKRMGFRELCMSEVFDTVDRANFRMIFEQEMENRKTRAQTPKGLQELMDKKKLIEEEP